ncbi:hypothetical protein L596_007244 [Steinernema carpocapsae]|uniref:Methylated-DNA--protein-cysteine methyltransferase n=1 Tax=Steinernema carpocapsae TaxID=34508 RepID=A0A4U5P8R9_STECR|nr:hypothetical protein L596_007244 [Steinernema carpocapsae]
MVPSKAVNASHQCAAALMKTPIGELEIKACRLGLHSITALKTHGVENLPCNPSEKGEVAVERTDQNTENYSEHLENTLSWIRTYFAGKDSVEKPVLCSPVGNTATFGYWVAAQEKVKFGERASYGQLASMCGQENASRAVGNAMRKNPYILLVPCHRIVKSDGSFGNYSAGGPPIKEWLLNFESSFAKCGI